MPTLPNGRNNLLSNFWGISCNSDDARPMISQEAALPILGALKQLRASECSCWLSWSLRFTTTDCSVQWSAAKCRAWRLWFHSPVSISLGTGLSHFFSVWLPLQWNKNNGTKPYSQQKHLNYMFSMVQGHLNVMVTEAKTTFAFICSGHRKFSAYFSIWLQVNKCYLQRNP